MGGEREGGGKGESGRESHAKIFLHSLSGLAVNYITASLNSSPKRVLINWLTSPPTFLNERTSTLKLFYFFIHLLCTKNTP